MVAGLRTTPNTGTSTHTFTPNPSTAGRPIYSSSTKADRLKTTGLEQVRDFYDRHSMGVILVGMPAIEKRLARYPQLYSRIGFAHEYGPLRSDELAAAVAQRLPGPTQMTLDSHNPQPSPRSSARPTATSDSPTASSPKTIGS